MDIPSGKPLHNELENHYTNGKTHYFDWAIFNSYVCLPEATWNPQVSLSKFPCCQSDSEDSRHNMALV